MIMLNLLQVPGVSSWRVACVATGAYTTSRQQRPKKRSTEDLIVLVKSLADQVGRYLLLQQAQPQLDIVISRCVVSP